MGILNIEMSNSLKNKNLIVYLINLMRFYNLTSKIRLNQVFLSLFKKSIIDTNISKELQKLLYFQYAYINIIFIPPIIFLV